MFLFCFRGLLFIPGDIFTGKNPGVVLRFGFGDTGVFVRASLPVIHTPCDGDSVIIQIQFGM